jgi:CheY-like chemotaxis protein
MAHLLSASATRKATLRYDFEPDLPPVEGDATQLRQVVMNLITNASEALGEESGQSTIRTGAQACESEYLASATLDDELPPGRYVFVEVSDTGAGMTAEARARMFDPFYSTKFSGRGLGLAAVLGIVRGHRGAIKVHSEEGRGTTIKVLLPVAAGGESARTAPTETPASETPAGRGTVLLVDDERAVLEVASKMLEVLGFEVLTAADGRAALDHFGADPNRFALVLLDLTMPRMDGEETFRQLRDIRPDVVVVLSSGYNEQDLITRFAGKGLAGFIQKPYRLDELSEIIDGVLDRRSDGAAADG